MIHPAVTLIQPTNIQQVLSNEIMQRNLGNLELWCNLNKLTINSETKVMYFGSTNKLKQLNYSYLQNLINGNELMRVENYKYLGVTLDYNFNFRMHIDALLKTLRYKLYILSKLRCYMTMQASLSIYKTTILPYIDYGDNFYQAGP